MLVSKDSFNIKKEIDMLSCVSELALPCESMGMIYEDFVPIQSSIGKPIHMICFIIDEIDDETGKSIENICKTVNKV